MAGALPYWPVVAVADEVQLLPRPNPKPSAGKPEVRPRQFRQTESIAVEAHAGGDVGHIECHVV